MRPGGWAWSGTYRHLLSETHTVIQAIMLSSHKSCHGEGNWYLQEGAHVFKFAITTHKPGWENGYCFRKENNYDFYTVVKKEKNSHG